MTDKLAVTWFNLNVAAEGHWAIGAAIMIVAITAAALVTYKHLSNTSKLGKPRERRRIGS
jgi:hypothetical protein